MSRILGIDLGTTNSCAAVVDVAAPRVLGNREGSRTTASIVAFTDGDDRLVGQIAKRQAITNPQNTVYAVKRLIGRKFEDDFVQKARNVLPYSAGGGCQRRRQGADPRRQYSPEEISAMILREIKEFAEDSLGETIEEAIITVPAYFNDAQRQATRDAGGSPDSRCCASSTSRRPRRSPTGSSRQASKTVAVYDLGGGTFDISILELAEGIFEVKATSGDPYLGGEDFDETDHGLVGRRVQGGDRDRSPGDRMALQRLKEAAENAKCELSTATEVEINLPFISADDSGPRHLSRTLTGPSSRTWSGIW